MITRTGKQGFTITEVLISLAILGIIAASISGYFGNVFIFQSNERIKDTRDVVARRLQTEVANPEVLASSAAIGYGLTGFEGNSALADCLNPTKTCVVARAAAQQSFQLVRRIPSGTGFSTIKIAGTSGTPQLYDTKGVARNCAPGRSCPFATRAFFWATCPVPLGTPAGAAPVTCINPETINVRYQLSQSYDPTFVAPTASTQASLRFESVPPGIPGQSPNPFEDNPGDYAFSISAKDIRLRAVNDCKSRPEPNSVQAGVDKNGTVICNCTTSEIPGSRALDPLGLNRPLCTGASCPAGTVMVGLKVNATTGVREPQCERKRECCWSTFFADPGDGDRKGGQGANFSSGVDCGLGARMVKMTYGTCEAKRRKKDTTDQYSYCVGSQVVCCRDVMFFDASPTTTTSCNARP